MSFDELAADECAHVVNELRERSKSKELSTLSFHLCDIPPASFVDLLQHVRANALVVDSCRVVNAIVAAPDPVVNTTLEKLCIDGRLFPDATQIALLDLICRQKLPNLKHFAFTNGINVHLLLPFLSSRHFQSIDLTRSGVSVQLFGSLIPHLVSSPLLEDIVLNWNHHTAQHVKQIAMLIGPASHDRLRRMEFLGWTTPLFGPDFIDAVNYTLGNARSSTILQVLNIGDVADTNMPKICDMLQQTPNCALQSLAFWLRDRSTGANEHIQRLCAALTKNTTLLSIDENNTYDRPIQMNIATANAFANMIQTNQTLTRLSIRCCLFTQQEYDAVIVKALNRNYKLLSIVLPQTKLEVKQIERRNSSLLWPSACQTITDVCIALQCRLPPYVLLEVIDWLPGFAVAVSHVKKIRLIEGVHKSIAKCAMFQHLLQEE